jgi:toxin ParE1/3/4
MKKYYRIRIAEKPRYDGYQHTGFMDWGYQICTKPRDTYLVFYVVDESKQVVPVLRIMQDGMNWQYIIGRWIRKS